MKLTKKVVDGLSLPKTGQLFYWDSDLKGFGLRLTSGSRTYIIQARVNGTTRRVTLGRHGVITADEARKKAVIELANMLGGKDPVIEKQKAEAYAKTLRALADDYIAAHGDLKESSKADINKHVDRSFSDWRERPAAEITRDEVAVKFRELSERSSAQANQAFRILRALFNYARAAYRPDNKSIIIENPCDVLSQTKVWNRVPARSGRIPTDKIGVAWNVLQTLRTDDFSTNVARTASDTVSFLLLTGCRWSEAAELTWDRVDLDGGSWHLPDPKNRNPVTFPLSVAAIQILEARSKDKTYVFPSWGKTGRIKEARGVLAKLSEVIGRDVTAHDLRRTFRAIAGECGIELWKTKLLMNHKLSGDITITHYTETSDLRYLSPEIELIGEWITKKALETESTKVVPMQRKA